MYSASEKLAIIRLVEDSELSIRRTLLEINVSGLGSAGADAQGTGLALYRYPRVLYLGVQCLSDTQVPYADVFQNPTRYVHELWQTDFTYFRVVGWGWYFLSTVLDDYSRYIISWRLKTTMAASDVTATLKDALEVTGLTKARVHHKPRLLSDNGPCYISKERREWLQDQDMKHTRGAPYHPMTQGKIERYHRSMKNVVKLENYYYPWELENAIAEWVAHYNHERYHESLDNVTPADVYNGRRNDILEQRSMIKTRTLTQRKIQNLRLAG